jgi:hypothetical protein
VHSPNGLVASSGVLTPLLQAKVVLVDRDLDTWYASFAKGIIANYFTWKVWIMINLIDPLGLRSSRIATTVRNAHWGWFGCDPATDGEAQMQTAAKLKYIEHYEMVRKLVPQERLLNYQLGSGWEPLCEFLGKPVPKANFPHLNEGREFQVWMKKTQEKELRKGLVAVTKYVIVPLAVLGVARALMLTVYM